VASETHTQTDFDRDVVVRLQREAEQVCVIEPEITQAERERDARIDLGHDAAKACAAAQSPSSRNGVATRE